jgi:hypothetical protein
MRYVKIQNEPREYEGGLRPVTKRRSQRLGLWLELPSANQTRKPLDQNIIMRTVQIGVCGRKAPAQTEGQSNLRRKVTIVSVALCRWLRQRR